MALPQISSSAGFNTLLVATDLSARSKRGLFCAAALARRSRARLLVAHVINPERWHLVSPEDLHPSLCHERRTVEKKLSNLLKSEELQGVRVDTVIKEGDFRRMLCEIAHEQHADLLIVATHGRTGLSKFLLGSKMEEVCQRAPCPVLLVGPKAVMTEQLQFDKLLYATDLSTLSLAALPLILAFASQYGSRLRITRVIQNGSQANGKKDFALAQTKAEIAPAITTRAGLPSEPEFDVQFGVAKETILRAASEWNANLIGIGVHRPGTLAVYLPGDLAYDVACDAHCPVLTIIDS